jgi:hypothetical protein
MSRLLALTLSSDQIGSRLIFLISQPRSGSTMLQLLLAQHPAIASLPEPWFMLHFAYALRKNGVATEYSARYAYRGLNEFIAALPDGRDAYLAAVRSAAISLYESALVGSGKNLFLDKTPRYYLIIPELTEAFPGATFLFLIRHPLDVFSSVLEAQTNDDWTRLARRDRMHDLVTGPRAIHEATSAVRARKAVIHYEDLVQHPEQNLREICNTLGLAFDPKILRYGYQSVQGRPLGDRRRAPQHEAPVTDYVAVWRRRLDSQWKRGLALAYLRELGTSTVEGLGYDYSESERELLGRGSHVGSGNRRWRLITVAPSERTWRDKLRLAVARSVSERGWFRTMLRGLYIVWWGRPPSRLRDPAVTD